MITIFGYQIQLPPEFQFLANIFGSLIATVLTWVAIAIAVYLVFSYALRWLTRRIPGEIDDIILGIVRKPLLVLIIVFGTLNFMEVLQLPDSVVVMLERIFNTFLVLIVVYLLWRIVKDVVVYYGESWAKRTESRIDDVVIPIVNLFGPLLLIIIGALLILPKWGIDVTSILFGAGVVGLVLGLALQETLSNIFSGINLMMDAPFRTGDLIVLNDGKICQVEKIGLRATQLYYLEEHSTIYVPNKDLANSMIVNITKPTVDLKVSVNVGVSYKSDMVHVKDVLEEIALAHPNVLGDIKKKVRSIGERMARFHEQADEVSKRVDVETKNESEHRRLLKMMEELKEDANKYQKAIDKFKKEDELDQQITILEQLLQKLTQTIKDQEVGGLTVAELIELHDHYTASIEEQVQNVVVYMMEWSAISDPWAKDDENKAEKERWWEQNERLQAKWAVLKQAISRPSQEQEMRLDDMTQIILKWIRNEYKLIIEEWKEPEVTFKDKGFAASSIDLQLDFYVDDIRLEHFERKQRVVTEVAMEIHRRFKKESIEIPFTQMDVWIRKNSEETTEMQK